MKVLLTSVASLLLGVAILLAAHGLIGTLLTLRLAEEQYSSVLIGIIMSAYFFGYIIGTRYCPRVINRIGHIRSFAVSAALCSSIVILQGLIVNPWFWLVERVVYGICIFSLYLIAESWLNAQVSNQQRGRLFAIYTLTNLAALSLGQQLLMVASISGLVLFAIAAALFSFSLIPVAFTRLHQPEPVAVSKINLRHLYETAPAGMIGCVITGLAGGAFWTMTPLFAHQSGFDTVQTSSIMSITILGGAALQLPLGFLSDRYDRRKILLYSSLLASIFATISTFIDVLPFRAMLLVMFIYGGLYFAIYPLCVSHANDQAGGKELVKLSGGLLLCYGIGAVIGPLVAGLLMQVTSPRSLPIFYAISWLILGLFVRSVLLTMPKEEENQEQQPFMPSVRTSAVALEAVAVTPQKESEK